MCSARGPRSRRSPQRRSRADSRWRSRIATVGCCARATRWTGPSRSRSTFARWRAIAHVSPAHFSRQFRATFGESPHHYLQRRRVERAMELLRETDRDGDRHLLRRRLQQPRHVQSDVQGGGGRTAVVVSCRFVRANAGLTRTRRVGRWPGSDPPAERARLEKRAAPAALASGSCSTKSHTPSFTSSTRTRRWTSTSASWGWSYTDVDLGFMRWLTVSPPEQPTSSSP